MTEPYPNPVYDELARTLWPDAHLGLFLIYRFVVKALHLNPNGEHPMLAKGEREKVMAELEKYERRTSEDSGA